MVERSVHPVANWKKRWIEYGLNEARTIARMSKDPSTQCGAAILRPDKTVASKGYNGFPMRLGDDPALYLNREEKYKRVVHCEMNAILTAREPLHGYVLFLWPFLSCERCAVHVIQAGIGAVVAPDIEEGEARNRWGASLELSRSLFREAGITVVTTDPVPEHERESTSPLRRRS